MKLIKSLILGTAAIFAASWGAQAADLPVKAKPVDYVRICSAYGAGFYYIPGTEICLRVGGYAWSEWEVNDVGNQVNDVPGALSPGLVHDRNATNISNRSRATFIMDARSATQYGTLRAFGALGIHTTTAGIGPNSGYAANTAVYPERAFVQLGGWTFGYTGSFFDFSSGYTLTTLHSYSFRWTAAFAYTAQFGNGASATLSIEDPAARRNAIQTFAGGAALGLAVAPVTNALLATYYAQNLYGGASVPDIIGNLRVDGPWGSAQISGLLHQLRLNEVSTFNFPGVGDTWGGAVNAGLELKTPTGPGDSFLIQGAFASGAVDATGISANPLTAQTSLGYRSGGTNTGGAFNDAVGPAFDLFDAYVDAAGVHRTQAWSFNVQFRHFWDPMTRTTIFAGYNNVNVAPQANAVGHTDNSLWQVGVSNIWSPVKDFDLGVEVLWTHLATSCPLAGGCAPVPGAVFAIANIAGKSDDIISAIVRARRNW